MSSLLDRGRCRQLSAPSIHLLPLGRVALSSLLGQLLLNLLLPDPVPLPVLLLLSTLELFLDLKLEPLSGQLCTLSHAIVLGRGQIEGGSVSSLPMLGVSIELGKKFLLGVDSESAHVDKEVPRGVCELLSRYHDVDGTTEVVEQDCSLRYRACAIMDDL